MSARGYPVLRVETLRLYGLTELYLIRKKIPDLSSLVFESFSPRRLFGFTTSGWAEGAFLHITSCIQKIIETCCGEQSHSEVM